MRTIAPCIVLASEIVTAEMGGAPQAGRGRAPLSPCSTQAGVGVGRPCPLAFLEVNDRIQEATGAIPAKR